MIIFVAFLLLFWGIKVVFNNKNDLVTLGDAIGLLGDVNGDGKVSSSDYILIRKHILGQSTLTGNNKTRADVNSDNKINSLDYIKVKKMILSGNTTNPVANNQYTCAPGYYLEANHTSCTQCSIGSYCPGGTFSKSSSIQGKSMCPNGYTSVVGTSSQTSCYLSVAAGKHKTSPTGTDVEWCDAGTHATAHNSNYNSVDKCITCPANTYSSMGWGHCEPCPSGQTSSAGSSSCSSSSSSSPSSGYVITTDSKYAGYSDITSYTSGTMNYRIIRQQGHDVVLIWVANAAN